MAVPFILEHKAGHYLCLARSSVHPAGAFRAFSLLGHLEPENYWQVWLEIKCAAAADTIIERGEPLTFWAIAKQAGVKVADVQFIMAHWERGFDVYKPKDRRKVILSALHEGEGVAV